MEVFVSKNLVAMVGDVTVFLFQEEDEDGKNETFQSEMDFMERKWKSLKNVGGKELRISISICSRPKTSEQTCESKTRQAEIDIMVAP